MDYILKCINNISDGLNNTDLKNQIEEYFLSSSENKIYIMLPKSDLKNSIDIWLPNF